MGLRDKILRGLACAALAFSARAEAAAPVKGAPARVTVSGAALAKGMPLTAAAAPASILPSLAPARGLGIAGSLPAAPSPQAPGSAALPPVSPIETNFFGAQLSGGDGSRDPAVERRLNDAFDHNNRRAAPEGASIPSFPSSKHRQAAWGTRQLPRLTADQEDQLFREFRDDGRDIVIITDSHKGMRSGVVTVMDVIQRYVPQLLGGKVKVRIYDAEGFPGINLHYQNMRASYVPRRRMPDIVRNAQAVHLALEGPVGLQVKKYLDAHRIPYTTAYHTMRPEIVQATIAKVVTMVSSPLQKALNAIGSLFLKRELLPDHALDSFAKAMGEPARRVTNALMRRFHRHSKGVLVPTLSLLEMLEQGRYDPAMLRAWSHGVELDLFSPSKRDPKVYEGLKGPISLYVGRIAPEKNLLDFLDMDVPGTKVLVGDGPELESLRRRYPDAVFLGRKNYLTEVPALMASADIFVFPSLTDTFGLVQLEALASGTPVIGYRVHGPKDVVRSEKIGALADHNRRDRDSNVRGLEAAWHRAIGLDRGECRRYAEENSWKRSVVEFLHFLYRRARPKANS